mmetsp:Transcript_335/g.585  ORF Transcript_335/g.585 Transcript_335/m.585 type:complete len:274 (+) Transcript_335:132-953(+)
MLMAGRWIRLPAQRGLSFVSGSAWSSYSGRNYRGRVQKVQPAVAVPTVRPLDPPYCDAFLVHGLMDTRTATALVGAAEGGIDGVPDWDLDEEKLDGGKLWQHHVFALDAEYLGVAAHCRPLADLFLRQTDARVRRLIRRCFVGVRTPDLTLTYCFLRKYNSQTREGLRLHRDMAEFTVSIQLASPRTFVGGALELHDRQASVDLAGMEPEDGFESDNEARKCERSLQCSPMSIRAPLGGALLHRGFLYHRVAPTIKGTRYSMLMFYDYPDIHV